MKNIDRFKPGDHFVARMRKSERSVTFGGVEKAGKTVGPFIVTHKKGVFLLSGQWKFHETDWTFTKV